MSTKATHLTKHGVKKIIEEFDSIKDTSVVLQVIEVQSLENSKNKSGKARVTLSDGVTKMFGFVLNKAFDKFVRAKSPFFLKFDVLERK